MKPVRGVEIGYTLSSEERQPGELVTLAQRAEAGGFGYALISDHFHPWSGRQGSSPFGFMRFYEREILPNAGAIAA